MTLPLLVVSDTSPLSNLAMLGWLDWLKTRFGKVLLPPGVAAELGELKHEFGGRALRQALDEGWLEIKELLDPQGVEALPAWIHRGEKEAILLAEDVCADYLLMDDSDGRKVANQRGLNVVGVMGVLLWAKQASLLPSVSDAVSRLRTECGFFISPRFEAEVLRLAGELRE